MWSSSGELVLYRLRKTFGAARTIKQFVVASNSQRKARLDCIYRWWLQVRASYMPPEHGPP